ncbi:hypothetical protein PBAL39_02915 [Pedobacter sp. BAL39]|nr:hypothetical protein PBAL39_02915 [Pedobacter sp. BAL39]
MITWFTMPCKRLIKDLLQGGISLNLPATHEGDVIDIALPSVKDCITFD